MATLEEYFFEKLRPQFVTDAGECRWQAALVAQFLNDAGEELVPRRLPQDRFAILIGGGHRGNGATAAVACMASIAVQGRERAVDRLFPRGLQAGIGRCEPSDGCGERLPLTIVESVEGHTSNWAARRHAATSFHRNRGQRR